MSNPIGWCEKTWNPVTGCTPISPGCANCYAKRMATRLAGRYGYPDDDPFRVTLHPKRLEEPLHWCKPQHIFVCSMADLFHDEVPFEFVDFIFAATVLAPQHTYLILTKRPRRMAEYIERGPGGVEGRAKRALRGDDPMTPVLTGKTLAWPLPHVWLGVTAEDQQRADERIPILLSIPAAKRFVSTEPMLGPVDLLERGYLADHEWKKGTPGGLDWVIAGGETGRGARPMHPEWVRALRDQCIEAGVKLWFKSWGGWLPHYERAYPETGKLGLCEIGDGKMIRAGSNPYEPRLLDGRTWEERPA